MPRRPTSRRCPRCGEVHAGHKDQACRICGTSLVRRRFRMDRGRLARVHMLATQKGLINGDDDELYRLRLQAAGVESSKDFRNARQYLDFVQGLAALPDAR